VSGWPHSPQNLKRAGFSAPQPGHRRWSGRPHSPQNFVPAGFSPPQLVQRMLPFYSFKLSGARKTPAPSPSSRTRIWTAALFADRRHRGRGREGATARPGAKDALRRGAVSAVLAVCGDIFTSTGLRPYTGMVFWICASVRVSSPGRRLTTGRSQQDNSSR